MKKRKIISLRIIFTILTVLLMCTIFSFSSAPADESTEQSNEIGFIVGRIFVPGFSGMTEEQQLIYADSIDYYVRKTAHAVEYLALACLCSLTLYFYFLECPYFVFILGWLVTVLYAESDEIHQSFVPGRACMITDVLIDAGGALTGIIIISIIHTIARLVKNNKP